MPKQTAVEWAFAMLGKMSDEKIKLQAKAMEKEQIVDAYGNEEYDDNGCPMSAEQYYNETYGGGNNE
jgi:hypothetical protein